ncbi:molybdopterin converting factor subunit 1 [Marinobacterium sediminicola]|uniref:Molybdopterin synthase sulfur carrier subunit n=1 Tax=Marinobacterium sediminicola TaxID=518898 RepID=A0ABY1RZJ0_9GAMM|nr:molybdopterin converting factor subunit 1 [Marinobacterium sediminicola]ULG68996.1 molybdopterin converting factor subunit 1 [Marinobacterium sediminicola]SMR73793.1 molybdopterin synthase sulfur carrier subunit [Marinobacterium sediminicola]
MKLVYFARIREQLGCDEEEMALPDGVTTLAELIERLVQLRGETWHQVLSAPDLICAINQEVAALDATLSDNDEVAFFPPVTGG